MTGNFKKIILQEELEMRKKMRRSVVLNKKLKKGDIIRKTDLEFKRPNRFITKVYT